MCCLFSGGQRAAAAADGAQDAGDEAADPAASVGGGRQVAETGVPTTGQSVTTRI